MKIEQIKNALTMIIEMLHVYIIVNLRLELD